MGTIARWIVAAIVTVHGLIHLLGAVKGFGWAPIPQLAQPISTTWGVAWLLATVVVVTAGIMLAAHSRWWWQVTAVAAVVSQTVILTSWSDAKAGTAANLVMLVAAGFGFAAEGPRSFVAEYGRRVDTAVAAMSRTATVSELVSEDDLARMPHLVAGYLRRSGAVGQPRVSSFRATIHGRIRSAPNTPWMTFSGEQTNTCGRNPHRLFHITATKSAVPVDVLHVFTDATATMRGRALFLVPFLHGAGPEMDRSETVTVFNDLCILAPAALLDAPVTWQPLDDHRVRGSFTLTDTTVTADLVFDDDHDLVDFISDDRSRAHDDGRAFTPQRWSTPIGTYRSFGPRRVATAGEARWHAPDPEGEFAYLEYRLDHITHNLPAPPRPRPEAPVAAFAAKGPQR